MDDVEILPARDAKRAVSGGQSRKPARVILEKGGRPSLPTTSYYFRRRFAAKKAPVKKVPKESYLKSMPPVPPFRSSCSWTRTQLDAISRWSSVVKKDKIKLCLAHHLIY
jgi:hypothetical protein